jgi:acetyl-CoA carboxylase biotin carboxyl carrier protein
VKRDDLRKLIRLVEESEIDELEIRRWGRTIRIVKNGSRSATVVPAGREPVVEVSATAPRAGAPEAPAASPYHEVKSPMVGTFYRAPSPEAPPFVDVGHHVRVGQTLCILEAMKLMNELQAEVGGVVRAIHVDNGAPVEYGQTLFSIELA